MSDKRKHLARLLCLVGRHRWQRVITDVRPLSTSGVLWGFTIARDHFECARCHREMRRVD